MRTDQLLKGTGYWEKSHYNYKDGEIEVTHYSLNLNATEAALSVYILSSEDFTVPADGEDEGGWYH